MTLFGMQMNMRAVLIGLFKFFYCGLRICFLYDSFWKVFGWKLIVRFGKS